MNIQAPVTQPRCKVFFHIATLGNYQGIVTEILESLKSSGLFKKIEKLCVGIVGTGHVAGLDDERIIILYRYPELHRMEFETLKHVQQIAVEDPDCLILYLHTKGCSAPAGAKSAVQADWRRYMLHFLVERHEECFTALADHDVCGVDWRIEPCRHFSGNFWWARGNYLATLPSIAELSKPSARFVITHRHNAEFWIGMNPGVNPHCLFDCGIWVYERYQFRLYPVFYYRRRGRIGWLGQRFLTCDRAARELSRNLHQEANRLRIKLANKIARIRN
jgi:hypothetical protein